MTIDEMLSSANGQLDQSGKQRHIAGTTSGAGAANGTTFVASGLTGVDDAYNEMEVRITSGANAGQRRIIGDWDNTSKTGTLTEPFTSQVAGSVTFEIGEKGVVSNHELIELFTRAQDIIGVSLLPEAFPGHTERKEIAGTAGVSAALPATLGLPPLTLGFKDSDDNERDVIVLPSSERDRFSQDAFLGADEDNMVAIFENALIYYRPAENGTLYLPVVPKFTDVSYSAGSSLPTYLHFLLVLYAVWQGWLRKERPDLAAGFEKQFYGGIESVNAQVKGTTMQSVTEK